MKNENPEFFFGRLMWTSAKKPSKTEKTLNLSLADSCGRARKASRKECQGPIEIDRHGSQWWEPSSRARSLSRACDIFLLPRQVLRARKVGAENILIPVPRGGHGFWEGQTTEHAYAYVLPTSEPIVFTRVHIFQRRGQICAGRGR